MSFLSDLGSLGSALLSSLNEQVGLSENTPGSLDTLIPGDPSRTLNYGRLGDYAKKIDKSAQRSYVETGYIRNVRPRQSEVLMQEPDITVLIKKRMFSSLVENYKPEYMDASEKLFYRASKKLFHNKCQAISNYEKLSKIERIITNKGTFDEYMLPVVLGGLDSLSALGVNIVDAKTRSILETLRKVKAFSEPTFTTSWIFDREIPAQSDLGEGTGVFELTLVSNFNCTVSTNLGGGGANLTIEDPYKLMVITEEDVEKALRESASGVLNGAFFRLTESQLEQATEDLRKQLNEIRVARGASMIRFFLNADSILFRKIRAVIDEEGREILFTIDGALGFTLDSSGISTGIDVDPSALTGTNGLKNENNELEIFKQVVRNLYLLQGFRKNNDSMNYAFNKETNAVRSLMMMHFAGKPIIQPMDVLHVFMGSKSMLDPKTVASINTSLSGAGIFNAIDNSIASIESAFDSLSAAFGGSKNSYAVVEKDAIAGPDFPMWLWNMVRNDFTRRAAGTHVFAGIFQEATHSYDASAGKYVLSCSASDNSGYFSMGQININPSIEVFNGALYDPLTPRDLEFDASSGFIRGEEPPLLQENILLLNSGLIKLKNGVFRGAAASEQIYQGLNIEKIKNSNGIRRRYEDPDGFVYRWKRGIQSLTNLGAPHPTGTFQSEASPNLNKNPFAGQDVMNVLSLLISGQPYNYNTFLRAAVASGAISRDDLLNESSSKSFFRGLFSDLSKQNATWGNFIPFKKLILNESAYNFLRSGELDIITSNRKITELLRERARRFDELVKAAPEFANNPQYLNVGSDGKAKNVDAAVSAIVSSSFADTQVLAKLSQDIIKLDFEIEQAKIKFYESVTNPNINTTDGAIRIYGDDVSFDPTISETSSGKNESDRLRERSEFRKRIGYLTQRLLWRVKANEDPNYFLVDDSYDKNYDIQAFEKSLAGNMELFNSTYTNVQQQIQSVAQILGLEVFADSQGHIQARPPQYNRMPSSVFYNMIEKKDLTGVRIFPAYLESLFVNQVQGLAQRIEILEDEIRIRAAALGFTSDKEVQRNLIGNEALSGKGSANFAFVTDPDTGLFGGKDIRVLLDQANPDLLEERNSQALKSINNVLNGVGNSKINFDILQRTSIINERQFSISNDAVINSRIEQIGKRLSNKTGLPAPTASSLFSTIAVSKGQGRLQLDVLNLTQQISSFLSERQSAIKLMTNAVKNLNQGVEINSSTEPGRTLLDPYINKNKTFPEILEHMIEDEDFDDYGEGSGKRYIIRDNQILSLRITERPPPYTMVEVNGLFAEGLAEPPQGLESDGGNAISTAWAVDFDMWRMYGARGTETFKAPFLSNPDTQCAPYALFLLNRARSNIFQGEVTIAGNEFIQAGEVYYIEDRNLLFYAESVSHDFSYGGAGGNFTTSITLKYGHNPGEYIPTILDIVGKALYTNKHQADLARYNRHGNANGDVPINTIVFDQREGQFGLEPEPIQALVQGTYGDQNRKNLTNLLLAAGGVLAPAKFGKVATIELRIYYNSTQGVSVDSTLVDLAQSIKDWILNPTSTNILDDGSLLPDAKSDPTSITGIQDDNIKIVEIDLGKSDEIRSPSQGAWNRAREIFATSGVSVPSFSEFQEQQKLGHGGPELFKNIVDVWVSFQNADETSEIPANAETPSDQSSIDNLNSTLSAFNAKIQSQSGS